MAFTIKENMNLNIDEELDTENYQTDVSDFVSDQNLFFCMSKGLKFRSLFIPALIIPPSI